MVLDEVYDIWRTPFWKTELIYAIVIISLIIVLLVGYFIKKYVQNIRIRDPREQAYESIAHLVQVSRLTAEEQKRIYSILTHNFKTIVCADFSLTCASMTDKELLFELKSCIPDEQFIPLQTIFDHAQGVKFAHVLLEPEKVTHDIDYILSFIHALQKSKKKS